VAGAAALNGVIQVADVDQLDMLLGPLAPLDAAKAALRAGKALVLTPHTLDPQGRVWLQAENFDSVTLPAPVAVPGVEVLEGTFPAQVILGPGALDVAPLRGAVVADPVTTFLLVSPATPDSPDRPTAQDALTLAFVKGGVSGIVLDAGLVVDPVLLTLGIGVAATVLLALVAGLMVTALALADGRADLQTLAAVGGPPRVRRRFAASSAGFVTGLGCLVGAASGLVVAWVLLPMLGDVDVSGALVRGPFVVSWTAIGFVVVAVPLLTSAVAWATTRSRIVLSRRPD
jgi:putative ABC transport system permease protein